MRDNDSGGFEPEPPKSSHNYEQEVVVEQFQRQMAIPRQATMMTINLSSDSLYSSGGRSRILSDTNDDDIIDDRVSLIPNPRQQSENIENPDGTNTIYTVFLIVNAALGAGLLNFPKSFDEAGGILVGTLVQASLLIFIFLALIILAHCADQNEEGAAKTLQDTMSGIAGRKGRIVASACVAVYCFGTTIAFLILIGDQFDRVISSLYGPTFCEYWYMTREFTMPLCAIVCILPLCYSRRIDFLRIPSTLGVFAVLYIVGLIAYEYSTGRFIPGPIKHGPTDWADVFLVIPAITFSYQCHVSVIPIYSCMKKRNLKSFTIAASSAIFLCVLCYTSAASFGYLTFGSLINEDILMSYSAKSPEVLAGIVAMALKTITTYPILLFCGREALNSVISDVTDIYHQRVESTQTIETSLKRRILIATPWFFVSLVCAVLIPNIGEVIRFLGSLAAVFIFIFPGLCLLQVTVNTDPTFVIRKSVGMIIASMVFMFVGAFIFGVVLTQAIESATKIDGTPKTLICT